MEYLAGETLATACCAALALAEALDLAAQITEALDARTGTPSSTATSSPAMSC